MANLKGYNNYQILKNVKKPVMFLGLPLKLAYLHLGSIVVCAITAMILTSMNMPLVVTVVIPTAIAFGLISMISIFYKKYGINGFELQQRDNRLPNKIEGDKSVNTILKEKSSI